MQRTAWPLRVLVIAVLLAPVCLSGCGRGQDVPTADVVAHLQDFKIKLSSGHARSGHVVIGLENAGPTVHELVVARTDLRADHLPLSKDGLTIDEEAPHFRVLGEDEHVHLSEQRVLDLVLKPGHYVLYCNLEGHYLGGMHHDLEVTG